MYDYRHVRGHIEVYHDGQFVCSADNMTEAKREVREAEEEVPSVEK